LHRGTIGVQRVAGACQGPSRWEEPNRGRRTFWSPDYQSNLTAGAGRAPAAGLEELKMEPATNQRSVLIVDDDEDFVTQLQCYFQGLGFAVVTAGNSTEALAAVDTRDADLAVVDLMMEHMDDGFVLCHKLKQRNSAMPVILVTGVAAETGIPFETATREERAWIKADALLAKPIRFEQLKPEVDRLLPE
jgi:CheY-like chemotaxis protein